MTNCDHITKVLEWGYDLIDGDAVQKVVSWGCTRCDIKFSPEEFEQFKQAEAERIASLDALEHKDCDLTKCFHCKSKYVAKVMWTGDANSRVPMSTRAHDKELGSYYDALRQGIEPISTKKKDIDAAVRLSHETGTAFDANKI